MMVMLQALAFAGCALLDLLPAVEVDCRLGVPLATWGAPATAGGSAPAECPAPPATSPTEQCTAADG
jgi:hypothetical protein